MTICLSFILGSIIGSFLNVLIYRIPKDISIISPRSFCPYCNKTIPLYRNIPIISYVIQRGHCTECSNRISLRYPVVELISSLGLLMIWNAFPTAEGILFYWMFSHLIVVSFIDNEWLLIPLPMIFSMILGLVVYFVLSGSNYLFPLVGTLTGLGFILLVYALTWLIYRKNTLGFGDFQLIGVLGAWVGQINIVFVLFLSSFLALLAFIIISYVKGYNRTRQLPFVPYLSIASVIIYFINQ